MQVSTNIIIPGSKHKSIGLDVFYKKREESLSQLLFLFMDLRALKTGDILMPWQNYLRRMTLYL